MKKISYNELGKYIKEKAGKEFGNWYSDNTNDYLEDVKEEYSEKEDIYKCHIELTQKGYTPLIIEFYKKYILDDDEKIIDEEYYI